MSAKKKKTLEVNELPQEIDIYSNFKKKNAQQQNNIGSNNIINNEQSKEMTDKFQSSSQQPNNTNNQYNNSFNNVGNLQNNYSNTNNNNNGYSGNNYNNQVYQEKQYNSGFLDKHTKVTKASKLSRIFLVGFYLLVIVFGILAFFLIRANRYEFYLKEDSILLDVGSSYQIELIPKNSGNFDYLNYDYSIADESIATVDEYGTITAKGYGRTTLKIRLKPTFIDSGKTVTIVSENITIESLDIGVVKENEVSYADSIEIKENQSITIKPIVNNRKDLNVSASYRSSDTNVATVDDFGNVTTKKRGVVTITAVVNGHESSIRINVKRDDTNVVTPTARPTVAPTINPTTAPTKSPSSSVKPTAVPKPTRVSLGIANQTSLYAGNTLSLTASVEPASIKNYTVKWTSSDEKVATVSKTGLVTGVKAGTVDIKATVNGVEGKVTIIVKNKVTITPKPTTAPTARPTINPTTAPTTNPTSNPSAPSGAQFSNSKIKLSTTSLTVNKGSTAKFKISLEEAAGRITVKSSDNNVVKLTLPVGNENLPICNQSKDLCFLDGLQRKDEIEITVTGVTANKTAYVNIAIDDIETIDGNKISGSGKVGILVK